jgi:hypothetical protein
MAKGWRELVSEEDAIPMVREWVSASPTRSPMGAVACLKWEDSELGYTDWLQWCLSDRLVYPPLFSEKSHIRDRHRGPVSVEELWNLTQLYEGQLRDVPDGAYFEIVKK